MIESDIAKKLAEHKRWLESYGQNGERAVFRYEDLRGADLRYEDLRGADFQGADLRFADLTHAVLTHAVFREANLMQADLTRADLRKADMWKADLRGADLRFADLTRADLRKADLREANLDFSCLPLWCGSLDVKIDVRIAEQLMYHALCAMKSVKGDAYVEAVLANKDCIRLANRFHRVDECGKIKKPAKSKEGGEE